MSRTRRPASMLDRMRANPQADWTIADAERLCQEEESTATPPRWPIKPGYIRALVALADAIRNDRDGA